MSKKVRLGIIGCGGIAGAHLEAYKKISDQVEFVATCDLNAERAKHRKEQYGFARSYTDYEEMLSKEELDAVSVCTWNNYHAPASIAALEAGASVLCEKPMAMNAKEAEAMIEAEKKSGKLLMIGFVRRFGENTKFCKSLIDNGKLGEIYYVKTGCIRRVGNPGGWFSDKKRSGGGPLIDLGVHMIDLARYLMGKPKVVSAVGATYDKVGIRSNVKGVSWWKSMDYDDYNDVEDIAVGFVRFDNGATLVVENSWTQHIKESRLYLELYGSKAGMQMEPELEIYSEENDYLTDIKPKIDLNSSSFSGIFERQIAHFIDCVANGTPCLSPSEDGLELMKILDGIYQSAETGREVQF
ncbi:MAG: Gfo/Idh/MocA family oxidoreductase [Firmicutes bacterium]|nr:Gfo/Idh/MocA family oxidoreductase [Bacillota bacterium]HOB21376.1 Gfo/Idh/MocA family oxidoreductase [Bacillota bacterium]HQD39913.1 Gfo/Idh/MocA family oxidoreductase [Bacillota bacterium]